MDAYIGFLAAGGSMAGRPSSWGRSASTSTTLRVWEPGFAEMERMVEVAEAG